MSRDLIEFWRDPPYASRMVKTDRGSVDIVDMISDQITHYKSDKDLKNYFIITGFPGSGKTTVARNVARKLSREKGWVVLHVMLRYENRIHLALDNYPPVFSIDSDLLAGRDPDEIVDDITKFLELIIEFRNELVMGSISEDHLKENLDKIQKYILRIYDHKLEGDKNYNRLNILKLATIILYLTTGFDLQWLFDDSIRSIIGKFFSKLKSDGKRLEDIPILIILDDIDSRKGKGELALELVRRLYKSNLDVFFLLVTTLTEELVLSSALGRVEYVDHCRVVSKELFGLNDASGDYERYVHGYCFDYLISHPSLKELKEILNKNDASSDYLNDERLSQLASCSGWHLSLIIGKAKVIRHSENPEEKLRYCLDNPISYDPYNPTINNVLTVINRFRTTISLVKDIVQINAGLFPLLLQPMGVSCREIEMFCSETGDDTRSCISELEEIFGRIGTCNTRALFYKLNLLEIYRKIGYDQAIETFHEEWYGTKVLAIRPGTYLYHIPLLLREMEYFRQKYGERSAIEKRLMEILDYWAHRPLNLRLRERRSRILDFLTEFIQVTDALARCRLALLGIHSKLLRERPSHEKEKSVCYSV